VAGARKILRVKGQGIPLRGDDIDTDRIIPARFLRCVTFEGLGDHVFEDDRKAGGHPFDDPRFRKASVLIAGRNFGCGSSREHAPQALAGWGIRAIVAESFAEIFAGNGAALGLVCASAPREAIDRLQALVERTPSLSIEVDVEARRVLYGGEGFSLSIPDGAREGFLTGSWDAVGTLLAAEDAIGRAEERLPYLHGWPAGGRP